MFQNNAREKKTKRDRGGMGWRNTGDRGKGETGGQSERRTQTGGNLTDTQREKYRCSKRSRKKQGEKNRAEIRR